MNVSSVPAQSSPTGFFLYEGFEEKFWTLPENQQVFITPDAMKAVE